MANYFTEKYGEPNVDPNVVSSFEPERANYFDKYGDPDTQVAQLETANIEDEDPTWADYGRMVMSGGAQIGAGIGWLFDSTDWGESLKQTGMDAAESWMENLSPQAKAALQVEFTSRDRGELWTDAKWNRAKLTAMQSLLGTMAGMGTGAILTKGLGAAGMRTAVTTAAGATVQAPSKVAGMIGYGLGEAAIAAPSVGAGVEREIMEMAHDDLYANAADYRAVYDALEGQDPAEREQRAKELLAKAAAGDASSLALVSTFLLSAPFGTLMGRMTAGLPLTAGGGRLAGAGRGAVGEAGQEFLQSGAEKVAENIGVRQADPSRGVTEGMLEEAVGGALAGGMMGGVVGAGADPSQAPVTPALPDDESPLAALAAAGEPPPPADELTETLDTVLDESAQIPDKDELDLALEEAYMDLGILSKDAQLAQEADIEAQLAQAADDEELQAAVLDLEQDVQESAERRSQLLPAEEVRRDAQLQKQRDAAFAQAEAETAKQVSRDERGAEAMFGEMEEAGREEAYEQEIAAGEAAGVGVGRATGELLGEKIQAAQQAQPQQEDEGELGPEPVAPVKKQSAKPDKSVHSMFEMMARTSNRLNRAAFEAEGVDPADMRDDAHKYKNRGPFIMRGKEGLTPDALSEWLSENDFINPETGTNEWDANAALNAVRDEISGTRLYHPSAIGAVEEQEYYEREVEDYERRKQELASKKMNIRKATSKKTDPPTATMPVSQELDELADEIRTAYKDRGLKDLEISIDNDNEIRLTNIAIESAVQGKGTGSEILKELTEFADDVNLPIRLEPALSEETLDPREGLAQFYERAGFKQDTEFTSEWIYTPTTEQADMFGGGGTVETALEQGEVAADQGVPGDLFSEGANQQTDLEDFTGTPELETLADEAEARLDALPDDVSGLNVDRNMVIADLRRLKMNKHPRADELANLVEKKLGKKPTKAEVTETAWEIRIPTAKQREILNQSVTEFAKTDKIDLQTYASRVSVSDKGSKIELAKRIKDKLTELQPKQKLSFVIDEKKFDEVGQDTNERVFEATVPKNRKGIDIQLKNAPYVSLEEADATVTEWEDHAIAQSAERGGGPQDHTDNFNRVILSMFDVTGTWANPYALAGYDVRAIDLKVGVDIQDLSSEYLEELFDSFGGKEVYGILAACPCTTFSNSGTRWRKTRHDAKDRDAIKDMWGSKAAEAKNEDGSWTYETPNDYANELVAQTMRTLEYYRPKFWALENPEGRIETSAGLPDKWRTGFQPNNFGDPYTKRTLLWGNFNAELPTANVEPVEGSKMHLMSPSEGRAAARAETPVGFSYAFFMANNYLDTDPVERTKADYWYIAGAIEEAMRAGVTEQEIRDNLYLEQDYEGTDGVEEKKVLRELIAEVPGKPTPPPAAKPRSEMTREERMEGIEDRVAALPTESKLEREAREEDEAVAAYKAGELEEDQSDEVGDIPGWDEITVEAATSPENDLKAPSKDQKQAGNYKMAHITIKGLPITIENPKGSSRRGKKQTEHYGYIRLTEGKDGDHLDVFVNPEIQTDYRASVYVIDQMDQETGQFDEHKVMLGYTNQLSAVRAYKRNYDKGWKVGPVTAIEMPAFKKWTQSRAKLTQPASKDKFFGEQSRLSGRASKGKTQDPQQIGRDLRFAKGAINAPNQRYVSTVLATQPGQQKTGDETAGMNKLVSQVIELQDRRERLQEQLPAEPTPYTRENLEQDTQPLRDSMPGATIVVLDTYKNGPASLIAAIEADTMESIGGVTDTDTGTVYIFADQVTDAKDANRLILHEVFHSGARKAFADEEFDSMLEDLHNNVPGKFKKGLQKIVDQYKFDTNNREDRLEAAEELLAHIAETDPKNTVLQKFVAKIRQMLRKMGIKVGEWSDAEITAIIQEAHGAAGRGKDRIAGVTFDEDVVIDETGEVFTVEQNAEEILMQINKREEACKRLQNCL